MFDGDIVFGLSTATAGSPDAIGFHAITAAAADVVTRAIVRGLLAVSTTTTPAGRWSSWTDLAG
jgi:L-aminopeptidase/D-esterase-like protein